MLTVTNKATFQASVQILGGDRVKYVAGGQVAPAGTADSDIGIAIFHQGNATYAAAASVGVHLHKLPVLAIASGEITDGATVLKSESGKVAVTGGGSTFGIATQAAEDGDLFEVIPL